MANRNNEHLPITRRRLDRRTLGVQHLPYQNVKTKWSVIFMMGMMSPADRWIKQVDELHKKLHAIEQVINNPDLDETELRTEIEKIIKK